jgi:hypothetical protein
MKSLLKTGQMAWLALSINLAALPPPSLTITKPDLIDAGWVSSLRDQMLLFDTTVEISTDSMPLDKLLIMLDKAFETSTNVPAPLIIRITNSPVPTVTGHLSGHPVQLMENLLELHELQLEETGGTLIVTNKKKATLSARSHHLPGIRLDETSPVPLSQILEKIRWKLNLPETAENRLTENGVTVGWRQTSNPTGKRAAYNHADHAIFLNATPDEHAWLNTLTKHLFPKPITIVLPDSGRQTQTHCKKAIILETNKTPGQRTIWKLQENSGNFNPMQTNSISPAGKTLLWVEETSPENFAIHLIQKNKETIVRTTASTPVRIPADTDSKLIIIPSWNASPSSQNLTTEQQIKQKIMQFPFNQKQTQ